MLVRTSPGQDQKELVPHPFGRRLDDLLGPSSYVIRGLDLDLEAERRRETNGAQKAQRVLVQGLGSHNPDQPVSNVLRPVEWINQAINGFSNDELPQIKRHGV